MSSPSLRQRLGMGTIVLARRLFAGTAIERLPITARLRARVFRLSHRGAGTELTATVHGVRLVLPAADTSVVPSLVGGYHEALELDAFETLARVSSSIADVGGNVGLYACVAAANAPGGRVVSFEPAPDNAAYLRRNLALNGFAGRVEVVAAAVSNEPGTTEIYLADEIGNHSLSAASAGSATSLRVPVTTLDRHFAGQPVDLIKIDVEGYEGHVLRGACTLLREHRPTVLVEYLADRLLKSGSSPAAFIDAVLGIGGQVLVFDERHRRLRPVGRKELLEMGERGVHANLAIVSREAHLAVLREFLQ